MGTDCGIGGREGKYESQGEREPVGVSSPSATYNTDDTGFVKETELSSSIRR